MDKDFTIKRPKLILIIFIVVCLFAFWGLNYKNSQEVYIDSQLIGVINDTKITPKEMEDSIKTKLEQKLGTNISLNGELVLKRAKSSKEKMLSLDEVFNQVYDKTFYKIQATSINVDGKEVAIVKNEEVAKNILGSVINKYIDPNTNIVEKTFVQDVKIEPKAVSKDQVLTQEQAQNIIDSNAVQKVEYKIQAGDTLYDVAIKYETTVDDILALNTGLTEDSILKIGQPITISAEVPFLSVKTVEKTTYKDVVKRQTEVVYDDTQYKTYRKVIEEGKDGEKEVIANLIKVNGVYQTKDIISETVLVAAVPEKVSVGTLNTPPKKAIGNFIYPVNGRVSSGYGYREDGSHKGIDILAPENTPVKASDGGVVIFSGWSSGYGNFVKIDHGNGFVTGYGHNTKNAVTVGQRVAQGEVIAYVGSTGNSSANHVHFEVIKNGLHQNPINYLK